MPWPEITFENWQQFIRMTESLTIGPPSSASYFYRGQSDASWGLTSSLTRCLDGVSKLGDIYEAEKHALIVFKAQSPLYADLPANIAFMKPSLPEWWAMMQHFQAPTRLLDWTLSPFVAAYFACCSNFRVDGALWLFHLNDMTSAMKKQHEGFLAKNKTWEERCLDPNPPPIVDTFIPREGTITQRMVAQQGCFTVGLNPMVSHDGAIAFVLESVKQDVGPNKTVFFKVTIPAELKLVFLRHLRSMNVTASSLFPGIDGLGRSLAELLALHAKANNK